MREESFDCRQVRDAADFYRQFAARFQLACFGGNRDALWDTLTGQLALPLCIRLHNLSAHPQHQALAEIVAVMREAERETDGDFRVVSAEE